MNREIKFRAWDSLAKEMLKVRGLQFYNVESQSLYRLWLATFNDETLMEISSGFDTYVLMQYTGLNDKNGKEGFSNDIIKTDDPNEELFKIEWFEHTASWILIGLETGKVRWIENREQFRSDFQVNFLTSEIIGNIYQNPELLNGS